MAISGGPTLRRRKFVTEMIRLRTAAGLSPEEAARRAEVAQSTISRIEAGRVVPRLPALRALLRVYGASETTTDMLVQLARQANVKGWWQEYGPVVPDWAEMYIGLEGDATEIKNYESQFVPGLLQTEDYALVILRDEYRTAPDEDIQRRVRLRRQRQEILTRDNGPLTWFCIDEAVLRRRVGGPEVMRAQLDRLLEVSRYPRVMLSVLPFSIGSYPSMGTPFTLLTFDDDPSIVYIETRATGLYLERAEQVGEYSLTYDYLSAAADSNDRARQLIDEAKAVI